MLSAFLRLPPRVTLVIIIVALGFVIYHLAAAGRVQPVWIVVALVLAFALARTLWRMWQARRAKGQPPSAPPGTVADTSASVALGSTFQQDPAGAGSLAPPPASL